MQLLVYCCATINGTPTQKRFAESEHTTRAMMLDRNQVPFYTSLNP